ncbi:MAG: ATP-binding protein [Pyrinomonadaceae bacterium]
MDAPLPQDFLAQAEELIDSLLADIQEQRRASDAPPRARRAIIDRTFRHAHTLKGAVSSVAGLGSATRLAHELENLLHALRSGQAEADDAALDACEDATEHLSRHIICAARGTRPEPADALVEQLRRLASRRAEPTKRPAAIAPQPAATTDGRQQTTEPRAQTPGVARDTSADGRHDTAAAAMGVPHDATPSAPRDVDAEAALASVPADVAAQLNAQERARLKVALADAGARAFVVSVAFDIAELDEQFRRLLAALEESCEIVSTLPGAPASGDDNAPAARIGFRLLCVATEPPAQLSPLLAPFGAQINAAADARRADANGDGERAQGAPRVETRNDAGAGAATSDESAGRTESAAESGSSIIAAPDVAREAGARESRTTEAREEVRASGSTEPPAGEIENSRSAPPPRPPSAVPRESPAEDEEAAGTPSVPSFIRVTLAELDDLAFAANELFDDTMRVLDAASALLSSRGAPRAGTPASEESLSRLRADFLAFVERVMALRMQTLARPLERAARAARVAARRAGRRVEIEIEGGDARVDRSIAERLAEPLAHLVRNAVVHGIEPPAARRRAGKPERGRLRLAAATEGSRVRVSVTDDGRGIDAEAVERAARAQGLVREGARFTEEQALRLIFRPGFSTAADVSLSAGRGVGLDAVEQEIEQAGGDVRVRTRRGAGTTFELRLPLPLALVHALTVRAGAHAYALDASRVVETLTRESAAADVDEGARAPRWRDAQLPLRDLRALPGQPARPTGGDGDSRRLVIVHADDARDGERDGAAEPAPRLVALRVDEILGRRDALVRSLGRHATRWRGVSGAIDMRDGTTAVMLDLPRLLEN